MLRDLSLAIRFGPVLLAFTGFACGGGGGGGAAVAEGLNEGIYDVASFGYSSPKPATFHPLLGEPVYPLVRREEVATILGTPEDSFSVKEDGQSLAIPPAATAGMQLFNATSGDVDGDGKPDLIVLGRLGAASVGVLHVNVLTLANSQWTLIGSFDVNSPGDHADNDFATVRAGDFDGDGREEILVAGVLDEYGWVRIYEDPIQAPGYGVLAKEIAVPPATEVKAIAAQLDEDKEMELVVFVNPVQGMSAAYALDDASHQYAAMSSAPLFEASNILSAQLVAFNRDGDAQDEIAVVEDRTNGKVYVAVYDDAIETFNVVKVYAGVESGTWHAMNPATVRRAAAGDIDGDGIDELVILIRKNEGSLYSLYARVYWGDGEVQAKIFQFTVSVPRSWDVAIVNRTQSRLEPEPDDRQLVIAYETEANSTGDTNLRLHVQAFDSDPDNSDHLKDFAILGPFPLTNPAPVSLVGEDFDNNGVKVRWKGISFQQLPDPSLIIALAAPPTKKGISQNYDGSEVSYKTTQGVSYSTETTWGASLSCSAGFEFGAAFGFAEVSGKITMKNGLERTESNETKSEKSVSFTGGYEEDVIIFQGTLHMIYVYEWVAAEDPAFVGTEVSINVPVATRTYKWTRQFFQDTFGANSPLPSDFFTHAIGNPATYPNHGAAFTLIANNKGFEGDKVTIGKGTGKVGVGLSMEEALGTETKWTTEVEVEAEGKLAGVTFGGAIGITHEYVWKAETTNGTEYEGSFGDIEDASQYFTWVYDVGIFVYRREDKNGIPFQVLHFWTDPWGSGY